MSEVVRCADEYWEFYRGSAQLWNIDRGDVDQIERWEDLSPRGVAGRVEQLHGFAARADGLGTGELADPEPTLLAALSFSARSTAVQLPYLRDLSLVAGPFNFPVFLSLLVPGYTLVTRQHGEGYVAKLRSLPSFVDGWVAGLRDGLSVGRVATARGIVGAVAAYDALLAGEVADDPLASQSPPSEASAREVAEWRAEVGEAIHDAVRPALARLRDVLRNEVLPVARSDDQAGICHLPDAAGSYDALLWASTSTDLTPEAVHALGVEQLALLDDEYATLGRAVVGVDDPVRVRERLREDPSFRYATAAEIVGDVTAVLARARAEAPRWFTRLPQASCTPVAAQSGPLAFYTAPSPDGARAGTFFYNTSNPAAWTRYQVEVTTFHEAVPGHHLQLALAQELGLHPILGELEVTSYGEGWGLYAERLADEMSLYSSPLQRLGMLTLDSLRAARLVVDTGLHAFGWTRDRAIDFLGQHTAHDRRNAEAEIDRYIADPGQATSYMVGRLELERLRHDARERLGDRFSLPEFHDVVLGQGMTPLGALGRSVDRWIVAREAS